MCLRAILEVSLCLHFGGLFRKRVPPSSGTQIGQFEEQLICPLFVVVVVAVVVLVVVWLLLFPTFPF